MSGVPAAVPGCPGCAARDEQISGLREREAALTAQVADLQERLARLERLLSRNSGNSSMPPSADDLPGRMPPEQRKKAGGKRRPGKQPGTAGSYLAWSDNPDDTIPHFPPGACGCGRDLTQATDLGVHASHQVTDIPADIQAQTIQHDRHAVKCVCGQVHVASPPGGVTGAPGTVTYGLRLQAWCVFLMVMHHVPVQRCADILQSLTGTRPSDGWVHALLGRAARGVATANKLIRTLIILASVICGDETPIRAGPGPKTSKKYLLVACTNLLTYYFLGSRDLGTFNAFVLPDLTGVIVHDRYQNYDKFPGMLHQLCTQHLLRDLEDAAQAYPDAIWPGQAASALRALIHAANTARDQGLGRVPAGRTAGNLLLFRRGVTVGLSQVRRVPGPNQKQPPARLLLECLRHREHDVLRFLTDLRIPPTSNQAERDLRPAKTQQKISGRLTSERTTRDRYAIRGYLSTAAKHGTAIFTAILGALTGNPWMPPIPQYA